MKMEEPSKHVRNPDNMKETWRTWRKLKNMEKNREQGGNQENWRIWRKLENREKTKEYRGTSRNLGNMGKTQKT